MRRLSPETRAQMAALARAAARRAAPMDRPHWPDLEQAAWRCMLEAFPSWDRRRNPNLLGFLWGAAWRAARDEQASIIRPFKTKYANVKKSRRAPAEELDALRAGSTPEGAITERQWEARVKAAVERATPDGWRGKLVDVIAGGQAKDGPTSGSLARETGRPLTAVYQARHKLANELRADPELRALWEDAPWRT